LKLTLPDLSSLLNAADKGATSELPAEHGPLPASSWKRIDSDVNGEWGYYLLLDQFLKSPAESRRAAAGWSGDRYDVYEGANPGQVMIAQVSAWDTENDAREFFDAYVKRTELRYPNAKRLDSETDTRHPTPDTHNFYSWQTSEGQVVIELRGLRVTIIEGLSQQVDANGLLRALRF
jgi:hypothetical protein